MATSPTAVQALKVRIASMPLEHREVILELLERAERLPPGEKKERAYARASARVLRTEYLTKRPTMRR